jgi:hypothetical protein
VLETAMSPQPLEDLGLLIRFYEALMAAFDFERYLSHLLGDIRLFVGQLMFVSVIGQQSVGTCRADRLGSSPRAELLALMLQMSTLVV